METEVNGKAVVLRDTLPAAVAWELVPIIGRISPGDNIFEVTPWPDAVKLMAAVIESWEFDGDPAQPEAYEEFTTSGVLDDLISLFLVAWTHTVGLFNQADDSLGESISGSTSPSED